MTCLFNPHKHFYEITVAWKSASHVFDFWLSNLNTRLNMEFKFECTHFDYTLPRPKPKKSHKLGLFDYTQTMIILYYMQYHTVLEGKDLTSIKITSIPRDDHLASDGESKSDDTIPRFICFRDLEISFDKFIENNIKIISRTG